MRFLILLVCFLPLTVWAYKGNFNYQRVAIIAQGDDCFKRGHFFSGEQHGSIIITHSSIKIGNRKLKLKPTAARNIYRIKGGKVRFIFDEEKQIVSVEVYQFDKVYCFS